LPEYDVQKIVLEANGFPQFNEMQAKAVAKGAIDKSAVISSPTASGKTVVAELAALNSILNNRKKAVYTCPLRALASEHYNDFKKKYSKQFSIKATISTGDLDSSGKRLENNDIIFTTYEKLDSLLRHKAGWLDSVGLLVVDEVHSIDSDRGPTLELVMTKFKFVSPKMQVLALSATIPNAKELAEWLDAKLVESDFRPVKLVEGVFHDNRFEAEKRIEEISVAAADDPIETIAFDTLHKKGKQLLVFANTRKRAESLAEKLSGVSMKMLTENEKTALQKRSESALNTLENPTDQCRKISAQIAKGASFHHAGLMQRQREVVEEAFRKNEIKVVCATPTLSAGLNLPAHTVAITSVYRFGAFSMQRIPVREYKQMSGRAGRPKFDSEGRSMILAKSEIEADDFLENYVKGDVEPVHSQLGIQQILRAHMLALIATGFVFDLASMDEFFSKTLYFQQFSNNRVFFSRLQSIILELQEMGFVKGDAQRFDATPIGRRVSELYLDPLSAYGMVKALKAKKAAELGYLFTVSSCSEMRPLPRVGKRIEAEIWEQLQVEKGLLPVNVDIEMFEDNEILGKFLSAQLLNDWISETSEEELLKKYAMYPGSLYSKTKICDWLCYSMLELARLLQASQHYMVLAKLRKRVVYGVREELIVLTEFRGIGRVRARKLFRHNVKGVADMKNIDVKDLSRIIGEKTALAVKKQLGQA